MIGKTSFAQEGEGRSMIGSAFAPKLERSMIWGGGFFCTRRGRSVTTGLPFARARGEFCDWESFLFARRKVGLCPRAVFFAPGIR